MEALIMKGVDTMYLSKTENHDDDHLINPYYDEDDEWDASEDDWTPGDAPWKAPGMSMSDFIR